MPGLVPGIHATQPFGKDVDGRDKPGHDGRRGIKRHWLYTFVHGKRQK